jgi:hypothetical protein
MRPKYRREQEQFLKAQASAAIKAARAALPKGPERQAIEQPLRSILLTVDPRSRQAMRAFARSQRLHWLIRERPCGCASWWWGKHAMICLDHAAEKHGWLRSAKRGLIP